MIFWGQPAGFSPESAATALLGGMANLSLSMARPRSARAIQEKLKAICKPTSRTKNQRIAEPTGLK